MAGTTLLRTWREPSSPAYPPPKSGAFRTLTQAEAEFFEHTNRSTGNCRKQSSSTPQTVRFRASRQLASTWSSPGRELYAQCVRYQAAMVAAGKNVFKRNPRPCQGGQNDYFEIVKRRDQISRRPTRSEINAGRERWCPDRPSRPDPWSRTARRAGDRSPWRPPASSPIIRLMEATPTLPVGVTLPTCAVSRERVD